MSDNLATRVDNVHVFKEGSFTNLQSIFLRGEKIVSSISDADNAIDGQEGYLIPGLIDSHVHITDASQLSEHLENGQTTVLDMACWPPAKMNSYRHLAGGPFFLSAGIAATSPGSTHSRMPHWPQEHLLASPDEVDYWVKARIEEGSDYIKVVCDEPGPSPDLVHALRESAREHGKIAVAHAANLKSYRLAIECGFDVITHAPYDEPITVDDAKVVKEKGIISTPTLVMERAMAERLNNMPPQSGIPSKKLDFGYAKRSVKLLHEAGVPVFASTDANSAPFPLMPKHGLALHDEMEILVDLGMTELEVLQSATVLPAKCFGLGDQGVIEEGMMANLVLLERNPLEDIKAIRSVRKVWYAGNLVHQK